MSWPVGLIGGFQGSLSARENATFVSRIYCEGDIDEVKKKVKVCRRICRNWGVF